MRSLQLIPKSYIPLRGVMIFHLIFLNILGYGLQKNFHFELPNLATFVWELVLFFFVWSRISCKNYTSRWALPCWVLEIIYIRLCMSFSYMLSPWAFTWAFAWYFAWALLRTELCYAIDGSEDHLRLGSSCYYGLRSFDSSDHSSSTPPTLWPPIPMNPVSLRAEIMH